MDRSLPTAQLHDPWICSRPVHTGVSAPAGPWRRGDADGRGSADGQGLRRHLESHLSPLPWQQGHRTMPGAQ
jgi:hypothetical protein